MARREGSPLTEFYELAQAYYLREGVWPKACSVWNDTLKSYVREMDAHGRLVPGSPPSLTAPAIATIYGIDVQGIDKPIPPTFGPDFAHLPLNAAFQELVSPYAPVGYAALRQVMKGPGLGWRKPGESA